MWSLILDNNTVEPRYNEFFFTPVVVKNMKKNLDITKPRYSGQTLPGPWPFVISRFHCIRLLLCLVVFVPVFWINAYLKFPPAHEHSWWTKKRVLKMQEASHLFDTLSIKVRRLFELWQQTASFFKVTLLNERFVLMTKDMWMNKFSVDRITTVLSPC